eukprot:6541133-Prymnesium_polylepis.1
MERLLLACEPWMDGKEAIELMSSLTCFVDLDDGCSFDEFGEALTEIEQLLGLPSWQAIRERNQELQAKQTLKQTITRFSPKKMAIARAQQRAQRRVQHERLNTSPDRADSKSCSSTSAALTVHSAV